MSDFLSFSLSNDFVNSYAKKKVNWGFPIDEKLTLGELTYISKYSRMKDDGSKEKWHETCRRVIEGMFSIQKDWCVQNRTPWNDNKAQKSAQDAYDRMFNFKWLPPGRGIQHMGSELVNGEHNSAPLQNCFVGSQSFIASDGVHAFIDSVGEEFNVLTSNGYAKGVVSSFGNQTIQTVTLKPYGVRSNVRKNINVTPDHRWILSDGTETTELCEGDVVLGAVNDAIEESEEFYDGLLHGLIYGDGGKTSHLYADGRMGFELRACDSRTESIATMPQIKSKWDKIYQDRPSGNGDTFYFVKSKLNLKSFPSAPSADYAAGFFRGWISADANIYGTRGSYRLDSQDPKSLEFVETFAALAGFQMVGYTLERSDTNFGPRKNPLNRFILRDDSILNWKVVSIEILEEKEEVFCLTVPSTSDFVLSDGMLTGNCGFLTTGKLSNHSADAATRPFTMMMEMSMTGIGVGFDTKGAGRLIIHEPSTEKKPYCFTVPDSREGWAEAVGVLLESFFMQNRPVVEFDYSQIRPAGSPLKRFNGTASGPAPLQKCIDSIVNQLSGRDGEAITSRDIVDIMNKIGKAVVAGGTRRSAQIVFGSPDDEDYVNIKNWELPENAERTGDDGWAWNSNNSIFAEVGVDYESIVDKITINGEPGLMWLDVARKYGRLIDPPTNADYRVLGANPCSEQSLEDQELCTLVELFPFNHDSLEDFKQTVKVAYLYGKSVTLLPTNWPDTNAVMARNRRIGCSMSGLAQFVEERGWFELRRWMDEGYDFICELDKTYSEWLAVRESIKKTSIKPSGTVSLLCGATPGVHWPTSAGHYIRRVRYASHSPFIKVLREAGYNIEPDSGDPENTVVVEFIIDGPAIRSEREVSLWEKAELVSLAQKWWADNQVSATLTFNKDEAQEIGPLLRSKDGEFKSISFLPIDESGTSYSQAPYEPTTKEHANNYRASLSNVNMRELYNNVDDVEDERFCTNDTCTI